MYLQTPSKLYVNPTSLLVTNFCIGFRLFKGIYGPPSPEIAERGQEDWAAHTYPLTPFLDLACWGVPSLPTGRVETSNKSELEDDRRMSKIKLRTLFALTLLCNLSPDPFPVLARPVSCSHLPSFSTEMVLGEDTPAIATMHLIVVVNCLRAVPQPSPLALVLVDDKHICWGRPRPAGSPVYCS